MKALHILVLWTIREASRSPVAWKFLRDATLWAKISRYRFAPERHHACHRYAPCLDAEIGDGLIEKPLQFVPTNAPDVAGSLAGS